jgi:hypothetical protein
MRTAGHRLASSTLLIPGVIDVCQQGGRRRAAGVDHPHRRYGGGDGLSCNEATGEPMFAFGDEGSTPLAGGVRLAAVLQGAGVASGLPFSTT